MKEETKPTLQARSVLQSNLKVECRVIGISTEDFDDSGNRIYTDQMPFAGWYLGQPMPEHSCEWPRKGKIVVKRYSYVRHEVLFTVGKTDRSVYDYKTVLVPVSTEYGKALARQQALPFDYLWNAEPEEREVGTEVKYYKMRESWYESDNPLQILTTLVDDRGDPTYARDGFYEEFTVNPKADVDVEVSNIDDSVNVQGLDGREATYLLESDDVIVNSNSILVRRQDHADNQPLRGFLQNFRFVKSNVFSGSHMTPDRLEDARLVAEMLAVVNPSNISEINRAFVFGSKKDSITGLKWDWNKEVARIRYTRKRTRRLDKCSETYTALVKLSSGLSEIAQITVASLTSKSKHLQDVIAKSDINSNPFETERFGIADGVDGNALPVNDRDRTVIKSGLIYASNTEECESGRPATDWYLLPSNDVPEYQFSEGEWDRLAGYGLVDDLIREMSDKKLGKLDKIVYCLMNDRVRRAALQVAQGNLGGRGFRSVIDQVKQANWKTMFAPSLRLGKQTKALIEKGEFTVDEAEAVYESLSLSQQISCMWRMYYYFVNGLPVKVDRSKKKS
ncbi:MAG: hypothetical protein CL489_00810 [Acidobacteria bacterium]|nr:hypothetical protein [Acidobacteriota bacterium]